jgi:hypothetical protein
MLEHPAQNSSDEHVSSGGEGIDGDREGFEFTKIGESGKSDTLGCVYHDDYEFREDE